MRKFLYVALAVLLGFLSGYFFLTFLVLSGATEVPDLRGKDIVSANQLLRDKGLHIRIDGYEYSELPSGAVSKQEPPAGTKIKSGREVGVIISKGVKFASFPELRGLTLEEAEKILREKGIPIEKLTFIHSDHYPEKTIIAQRPEPDEGGKSIKLLISKGRKED